MIHLISSHLISNDKQTTTSPTISHTAQTTTKKKQPAEIYPGTTTRERYIYFWKLQNTFLANLYITRLTTIAAIRGACPAGGCALSLVCDYRIYLDDPTGVSRIGLNEPKVSSRGYLYILKSFLSPCVCVCMCFCFAGGVNVINSFPLNAF
jgi:hypothetical protein